MRSAFLQCYVAQQPVAKLLVYSGIILLTLALGAVGLLRVVPALLWLGLNVIL